MSKHAEGLRSSTAASSYRVRVAPIPTVIDAAGMLVHQAQVLEISFPSDMIDTPMGRANVIVGAGVAKIMVGDATIRGVLLC